MTIGIDNRKVCNGVERIIKKASQHAQNIGVEIVQMKNILKSIKFKIEFKVTRIDKDK